MADEKTTNVVPDSGNAGESISNASSTNGAMSEIPANFGSPEWEKEQIANVRITRGFDGLPSTMLFPDGSVFMRDLRVWDKTNGYNPAIFAINGEPRITTLRELKYLKSIYPEVKPESVIYRKDFVAYIDYVRGVLRDSNGKIVDVRPGAKRGEFDQILNYGLSGAALELAKRRFIQDAEDIAESIANNDKRTSELIQQGVGYHGEVQEDNEFSDYYKREKVIESLRLYPQNEETEFALKNFDNREVEEIVLDMLAKNFYDDSLADGYLCKRIAEHYDALGDFYKNQLTQREFMIADVSSFAARDAVKGIYCREELAQAGLGLDETCKMSTSEVVKEFNAYIKAGKIDGFKGGNLDMVEYKATQKQCAYIERKWDTMYLPKAFTKKYSREEVAKDAQTFNDGERRLEYRDAKDAFLYNSLMSHLKPYVSEKKFKELLSLEGSTNDALHTAKRECEKYFDKVIFPEKGDVEYEGAKVTLAQIKELESHGFDPKKYSRFEDAKAVTDTFEPTKWQVDKARRFMRDSEIEKLNRGEIQAAINENEREYKAKQASQVSPAIKEYAVKCGLVEPNKSYTYEQWSKDSFGVPPLREQLAYIHKNVYEKDLVEYVKSRAKHGDDKFLDSKGEVIHSAALYEAFRAFKERYVAEKANSPMDNYQKLFFQERKMQIPENTTWKQAREAMVSTLYFEKLIGRADHDLILKYDNVISKDLFDRMTKYDMTDKERADVRQEVSEKCNAFRKVVRENAIDNVRVNDQSLYGSVRNLMYDYKKEHKESLKGVEGAVISAYAQGKLTMPDEELVKKHGNMAGAIAHVMATSIPECVGRYTEAVAEFSEMYNKEVEKVKQSGKSGNDGNDGL